MKGLCLMIIHPCLEGFSMDWKPSDVQDVEHEQLHKQKKCGHVYIHSVASNRSSPFIKALAWTGKMMSQFKGCDLLGLACAYSSEKIHLFIKMEKGVIGNNCIDFYSFPDIYSGTKLSSTPHPYFSKLDWLYNFHFEKKFLFRKAVKYKILSTYSTILICNTSIMGLKETNCVQLFFLWKYPST